MARLAREVQQLESAARRPSNTSAISSGCAAMDACLPDNGYAPGTVIEYLRTTSGCGATYLTLAAAASALRAAEEKYLLIVDIHHQLYPPALLSHHIPLAKVIWVQPQSQADAIWSIDQALRTPAVAAVIADLETIDERDARRLQLAAERGGGLGLLLRSLSARRMPSWAEIQWVVRSAIPSVSLAQSTTQPLAASSLQFTNSKFSAASKQPLRRLEVGLARVRGGKAGAQLLLDIDAATGTLELAAREKNRHEQSTTRATQSTSSSDLPPSATRDPVVAKTTSDRCGQGKRVLCIWLPNWPIQRLQAAEPQLANQPLALIMRDARRGMIVTAANLAARTAGVRSQMRLAEATGLAQLETRSHQTDEDIEALCSLAEQAQRFSPLVGLEQLDRRVWAGRWLHQPESLLLDVTGLAHLFNGYDNLLLQVGGWLRDQRYFGCLAIASTVGAAWAVANYGLRSAAAESNTTLSISAVSPTAVAPSAASNSNSAVTNSAAKPKSEAGSTTSLSENIPESRYQIVPAEQEAVRLESLPLMALRIDEPTHITLRRLGLRTLQQLFQLPRAGLANRLSSQLLDRWDQLTGECDEPIISLHGSPEWCVEQELELATDHVDTIVELVRRSIEQLAKGLEQRGEGAVRVVCRLDLVEHVPLILQLGMFRPTCDAEHLNLLASSLLEQQLPKRMKAAMWRVSTQATLTAPLVWRQGDLFNAQEATCRQQIASLVDTLSARLGRKQVLRAKTMRESQPELAYELQPLTGLRPDGNAQDTVRKISSRQATGTIEPSREDPLRRPAQLLNPPVAIDVAGSFGIEKVAEEVVETTSSQACAPARVKTANGWHRVLGAVGPERLESGWWKGQSARRDYYRIITHLGCWWWIYRDLNSGDWYLHGIFD